MVAKCANHYTMLEEQTVIVELIVSHRIKMLLDWIQVNDSAHLSSVGFQVLAAT